MIKGAIIWVIIIAVIVIGGFVLFDGEDVSPSDGDVVSVEGETESEMPAEGSDIDEMIVEDEGDIITEPVVHTVEITETGFSPRTLEVSSGDTVTWINKDSSKHWPASAVHPTHTVYPGSSIQKCGSSEAGDIFDACTSLSQGETYGFTFNEKGSWNYHNHLRPSRTGTIIVN